MESRGNTQWTRWLADYLTERAPERYQGLLLNIVDHVELLAVRHVGEELAQEVVCKVFDRLKRMRLRPEKVRDGKALITCMTKRAACDVRKEEFERRKHLVVMEEPPEPPPRIFDLDMVVEVRSVVLGLPEPLRVCVVLRYYDGLETHEIAKILGITQRAVQARLKRAAKILERRLSAAAVRFVLPALGLEELATRTATPAALDAIARLTAEHPRGEAAPADGRRASAFFGAGGGAQIPRIARSAAAALLAAAILAGGAALLRPHAPAPEPLMVLPAPAARPPLRLEWPPFRRGLREMLPPLGRAELPRLPEEEAAAAEGNRRGVIRVADEDGALIRRGVLQVLLLDALPGAAAPGAGEAATDGRHVFLLHADLAERNPAAFELREDLERERLLIRVKAAGYPPYAREGLELLETPLGAPLEIVLRSRPACRVRVREAASGEAARGVRVTALAGRGDDGRLEEGEPIEAEEVEPGLHVLRGLSGTVHDLAVEGPRILPVYRDGIVLAEELEVWVHPAAEPSLGSVSVLVTAAGGRPWAGAEVVARSGGEALRRTADADGRCRFAELPEGRHRFQLALSGEPEGEGTFIGERGWYVRCGLEHELRLGLIPEPAELVVAVRDHAGRPLEGVLVRLEGPCFYAASSDAAGEARFPALAEGAYLWAAARPGAPFWMKKEPLEVRAGANRAELRLGWAAIRGRLRSAAAEGTELAVVGGDRWALLRLGESGEFVVPDALAGSYEVATTSEERPGFPYRKAVKLEVAEEGEPEEVEIRLEGLSVLRVEVKALDGRPIEGAVVEARCDGGARPLSRKSTGARGAEFAALLEPGLWRVAVEAPGLAPEERLVRLRPGVEERVEVVAAR